MCGKALDFVFADRMDLPHETQKRSCRALVMLRN